MFFSLLVVNEKPGNRRKFRGRSVIKQPFLFHIKTTIFSGLKSVSFSVFIVQPIKPKITQFRKLDSRLGILC